MNGGLISKLGGRLTWLNLLISLTVLHATLSVHRRNKSIKNDVFLYKEIPFVDGLKWILEAFFCYLLNQVNGFYCPYNPYLSRSQF